MSINILHSLLNSLGVHELEKIDPNTQASPHNANEVKSNVIMQAIAPTAVAGIYDAARSETGLDFLASKDTSDNYLQLLFGSNTNAITQQIAAYANIDTATTITQFNTCAAEAIHILRANATETDKRTSIKNIASAQRPFFAPYLPAQIQAGKLLGDDSLDDNTNKMQGPVSTLLHKVENFLSGQESKEHADKIKNERM